MKVFLSKKSLDLSFIDVGPGDWVVLKPNLIKEGKVSDIREWRSVITDPALIEEVCLYVCDKLRGKGRVTICDAPQTDSSFERIMAVSGLLKIARQCQSRTGTKVEIIDLRNEEWINEKGVIVSRHHLNGDPQGNFAFNLARESLFYGHRGEGRYYGADYNSSVVREHHRGEHQEYLICGTPVKADVFINMPKMKTHKKTGVTLNLKNLVGINADKNWLPHHTEGWPRNGGDEFRGMSLKHQVERFGVKVCRQLALRVPILGPLLAQRVRAAGTLIFEEGDRTIRAGNWYGNDTCWRMVLDLNRCLLYGGSDGNLRADLRKRYYSVVDGRIGMEGMGPMHGDPVQCGIVAGGTNPAEVDAVVARVMGFDWRKIPMIREAFNESAFPIAKGQPTDIEVCSEVRDWNGRLSEIEDRDFFSFKPHFGWAGHIEYDRGN